MAVTVYTSDPPALLRAINAAVAGGKVETWSVDSDGDFTHTPEQWRLKAWLRPKVFEDRIVFSIFPPKTSVVTRVTYAVYHGRFIEMSLEHFDVQFQRAFASALAAQSDRVGTAQRTAQK